MTTTQQLTLDIRPDPRARPGSLLIGKLRIGGEFDLDTDLNRGDQLTIQIADADGQILATGVAVVQSVGFTNLMDQDAVIGTERQHRAKLG